MNQSQFENAYREQWQQFLEILETLEKNPSKPNSSLGLHTFPAQYRRLCNHYSLAQSRHYSPGLVDKLHDMVLRGHRLLYKKKGGGLQAFFQFLIQDFPRTIRSNSRLFWLAFLLFYGPGVGMGVATFLDPVLIYSIMDESQVENMENMYDPASKGEGLSEDREFDTDFKMFGFYVFNNISTGFRTFAGGMLFGVGSIFLLMHNGIMLGGVAGHLSHPPYVTVFWQFVLGHGAFELTAIVISGMAGLIIGYSILSPGKFNRIDSLRNHAPTALTLALGATFFFFIAAFIEAFWSPSTLPPQTKYIVSVIIWIFVVMYLLFSGKASHGSK